MDVTIGEALAACELILPMIAKGATLPSFFVDPEG
jgi:hypothetical protein